LGGENAEGKKDEGGSGTAGRGGEADGGERGGRNGRSRRAPLETGGKVSYRGRSGRGRWKEGKRQGGMPTDGPGLGRHGQSSTGCGTG